LAKEAKIGNGYLKNEGGEVYILVVSTHDFDYEKGRSPKSGEKGGNYGIEDESFRIR